MAARLAGNIYLSTCPLVPASPLWPVKQRVFCMPPPIVQIKKEIKPVTMSMKDVSEVLLLKALTGFGQ